MTDAKRQAYELAQTRALSHRAAAEAAFVNMYEPEFSRTGASLGARVSDAREASAWLYDTYGSTPEQVGAEQLRQAYTIALSAKA